MRAIWVEQDVALTAAAQRIKTAVYGWFLNTIRGFVNMAANTFGRMAVEMQTFHLPAAVTAPITKNG